MVGLFGSHSVEAARSAVRVQRTQRGELLHLLQQAVASASLEFSFDQQAREKEDVQQAHFSRQFVCALQEAREEAERSARAYSTRTGVMPGESKGPFTRSIHRSPELPLARRHLATPPSSHPWLDARCR